MPDLLLELFSEEIPARMQRRAAEDLKSALTNALVERGGDGLVLEGDLVEAGMGVLVNEAAYVNRDGTPMHKPPRRILPVGQTRFVGEVLAMVVAETPAQAMQLAAQGKL